MDRNSKDVLVIGGGIVGMAAAYFLARAGASTTVIERDSVGSHASGFAYGGLSPLSGAGIPGPVHELAKEGMRIHSEFGELLPQETGVVTEYRMRPTLSLSFTENEVSEARKTLAWQQAQEGYEVRWVDSDAAREIEPRVSDDVLGAVYTEGSAEVEPYKFVLALTQLAEKEGVKVINANVTGIKRSGDRVIGVSTASDEMSCSSVVVAMGPWSGEASAWLGLDIEIRPLKGQILRLRAPGPEIACSVGWAGNYANTKQDGLLWAGTTEEEAGFDEHPTTQARDQVMASLLKMLPSLADAELVQQTACLRPLSADGLPILGAVPGLEGAFVATGAGRKGILLGPAMGRLTADLVLNGKTDIPIEAFAPARF
ncbi:MAG: FAD-dependent oxidoreductase [Chloroflexi bacterium]|nr:FAD-dependent oxidoreductase [Chloroflexota bacterium]